MQTSDLFVPLVSADLWANQRTWTCVEQVLSLKPVEQILPIWLRPCFLDQNKFLGIDVIPTQPITTSRGGRETIWRTIGDAILHALKTRPIIRPPRSASSLPPSFFSRSLNAQSLPLAISSPSDYTLSPAWRKLTISSNEWEITVLFSPEDEDWVKPLDRLFIGMQRTTLKSINVNFILHRGEEGLPEQTEEAILSRVLDSRLTLALLSPNFLSSDWMLRYDQIQSRLRDRGQSIIHIGLKPCEWTNHDYQVLPRQGPVGQIGNDTAWHEISKELRQVLESYYPDEMPRKKERY